MSEPSTPVRSRPRCARTYASTAKIAWACAAKNCRHVGSCVGSIAELSHAPVHMQAAVGRLPPREGVSRGDLSGADLTGANLLERT